MLNEINKWKILSFVLIGIIVIPTITELLAPRAEALPIGITDILKAIQTLGTTLTTTITSSQNAINSNTNTAVSNAQAAINSHTDAAIASIPSGGTPNPRIITFSGQFQDFNSHNILPRSNELPIAFNYAATLDFTTNSNVFVACTGETNSVIAPVGEHIIDIACMKGDSLVVTIGGCGNPEGCGTPPAVTYSGRGVYSASP